MIKESLITGFRFSLLALLFCMVQAIQPSYALDVTIEGVEDSAIRDNIQLLLNTTDIGEVDVLDSFWQKQVRDTVSKAVEPYGYYNSTLAIRQDESELVLAVSLGEPLIIANLNREIIGEGRTDPGFSGVFNDFPLQVGDVLYQPAYEDFKTEMFNYALSNGFFDFSWQATRLDLVRETKQANILLIAQSGPQYYFGDLIIKGDDRSKDILQRLRPFERGDKYDAELLTLFNRTLNETGYYQRVIARPVVKDAVEQKVPIEVTLTHLPRDNFNVGIGFSTDIGVRLPFRWERPWVNDKGHSIVTDLNISEIQQIATARYRIPLADVANDYATFETSYQHLDNEDRGTESETFSLAGRRFWRPEDSRWQYSASLSYYMESFTQGSAPSTSTDLLMPGVSVSYLKSKGELGNREGILLSTDLEAGNKSLISDINLVKAKAKAKWIKNIGKHRLYLHSEVGAINTDDFDRVPATMRFFTGGDQSIRGFPFESLSSGEFEIVDGEEVFQPRGGRYLATASVEYAYPVAENWRAAVFFDAGTATNDFDEGLARSVGIGAHWLTLIGPVRLYLAFGESDVNRENTFRLHFILGPEL